MTTLAKTVKQHRWLSCVPVAQLKGIGPKSSEKLHALGLFTLHDLLFHLSFGQ